MYDTIKGWTLRHVPERVLRAAKKHRYLRTLRRSSAADDADLAILDALVRAGDRVVDVGANVGIYTKRLSELVAPDGEVHSFEPVPTSFRLLEWNVRKLRLRNVRLWQCAASDANGEVLLSIPYHDHGGRNYYRAQVVASAASSAAECVFAEARTLDSIFAGDDRPVTFVKCDVEGHEVSCLRGALDVIRRFQPAWLIEVSGDPDKPETCAADAFRVLRNGGYAPYIHCAGRLHARREGETAVNYVFLSESATARLRNEAVFGDA